MTSDDILDWLRPHFDWRDQDDPSGFRDAFNEIERLRAAIRHLYFNEGVCYGDNCEQCELVFGLCDDKAVRGD